MNLSELKTALDAADIDERTYSFMSDGLGEVYHRTYPRSPGRRLGSLLL